MASAIFNTLFFQSVKLTGGCNRSGCSVSRHLPFKAILAIIDERLPGFGFETLRLCPLAKTADAGLLHLPLDVRICTDLAARLCSVGVTPIEQLHLTGEEYYKNVDIGD